MKFYHKLLIFFTGATIIGLIVHLLLFVSAIGTPTEEMRTLNEWYVKKDNYAESISEPKIIFISGSNTLFGVDTQQIEKKIHIPTVNYGTHAGTRYYTLKRAQRHLKPKDIVVLPLEYAFYDWHHDELDRTLSLYLLSYDPHEITTLPLIDKIKLIAQISTKDLAKITYQRLFPPTQTETGYSSRYLNKNGDMTNNYVKDKTSSRTLQGKITDTVFSVPPLTDDAKSELTRFINYCHTNNITVYAAWPNYLWRDKKFTEKDLKGIYTIENFYHSQDVEILGNYTDCLYNVDLFYDTCYHLNDEGKRIHTDYLIQLLKEKIVI